MRPCDIMFEELTLRLSRPDNIRFVGEWVLPFDPNVVLVVTLDVIFLDGLAFVRFCTFLTPHQINGTEFLEKSLHNLSSIIFPPVYTKLHEMVIQTLYDIVYIPKYICALIYPYSVPKFLILRFLQVNLNLRRFPIRHWGLLPF